MKFRHPLAGEKKIVVIIGAGFAGLQAAKALADQPGVHVLLIDKKNHHLFQPLLYQVATAGLSPADISTPIRSEFSGNANIQIHLGRIEHVNLQERVVGGDGTYVEFDYLILACGTRHSYFSHPEWEEFAPGLKTLEHATEIRRRILLAFERAENEPDASMQKQLLTFVIVGGGPTGVELAGAIADISRTVLVKDFKRICPADASVILVEGSSKILGAFHDLLSKKATEDLKALGVEVRTSSSVTAITVDGVHIRDDFLASRNIFWAAGVKAVQLSITPSVETDYADRIVVAQDFSIPSFPHAFVVGDMASFRLSETEFLPGLAPAAIQSGRYAAEVILAGIRGAPVPAFRYRDKGLMATIGKNRAIAQVGPIRLRGRIAWLSWLLVHIVYLIGFRNRTSVLLQWAWSYIFSKRGARLITEKEWRDS